MAGLSLKLPNKKTLIGIGIALGSLLLTLLFFRSSFVYDTLGVDIFQALEHKGPDLLMRIRGERAHSDNIVMIRIDEYTINMVGTYPVPRDQVGTVMALLGAYGAKAVAFDIFLDPPTERDSAESGEIVAVAGFEEIGIGDTITDADNPSPLDPPEIEKPTVRMMFGVNKSPFAGRDGKYVTSRALRERLFKELETNVSLRVEETDSPDTFLVSGRGELHLAILIETMRREDYELQVSQPEAIFIEKDGIKMEPFEFLIIEVPSEYQGVVIEEAGRRKARLKNMLQAAKGGVYFEYEISTRAVIGLKAMFMTKTCGTAVINHAFDEYEPMDKDLPFVNTHGSLVSSETGVSTSYGLNNAQERGELFIGPNAGVYEGMIIGQNSRPEDLGLSPTKTKKLTNMRASGSDDAIILTPPREMTLELSIEYLGPDELLEVTPKSLRLRKKIMDPLVRKRSKKSQNRVNMA